MHALDSVFELFFFHFCHLSFAFINHLLLNPLTSIGKARLRVDEGAVPPLECAVNQKPKQFKKSKARTLAQLSTDCVKSEVDLKVENNSGFNPDTENHFWFHKPLN